MHCFLRLLPALIVFLACLSPSQAAPIDRHALVSRHNPKLHAVDPDSPLTVGNGNFAFGCDITGLQTFSDFHHTKGIPLETLSRWAWVSDPNPKNYTLADASIPFVQGNGRVQAYATLMTSPAGDWLRKNPRNHPLAQLSFEFDKSDGSPLRPTDIQAPSQVLDLWSGVITSHFKLEGIPVSVTSACAPDTDTLAFRIESPLLKSGKLRVRLSFPRGHALTVKNTPPLDWTQPESHLSTLLNPGLIQRKVTGFEYFVSTSALLTQTGAHSFRLSPEKSASVLDFSLQFSQHQPKSPPASSNTIISASAQQWKHYWTEGAAIDFSGSQHPQASELERRVILSQYLLAVQMVGDVPPQETGLTCSSWYGKHHTEMVWWHAAQFALWGHDSMLERNLAWYQAQLPAARALAQSRGLSGARWAKMTGNVMRESPGGPPLIVWNQPHLVYLCELLYRNNPTPATLAKYRELVLETADCLASMVHFDAKRGEYLLGPPLWVAQEIYDQATSQNPSFELSYWRWALVTAQSWRQRLGLPRDEKWDHVIAHIAPLPQKHGMYVALESTPDTWDNVASRHDHPSMLMPLGFLPGGPDVDRATMQRTLDGVLAHWDFESKIWGWDYPMIAMTAARLGQPGKAVEILLRNGPNNAYLPNGHCPQSIDEKKGTVAATGARKREIAVYLPANGSLLAAIALMAAGWDGNTQPLPGFPKDGSWKITTEALRPLP